MVDEGEMLEQDKEQTTEEKTISEGGGSGSKIWLLVEREEHIGSYQEVADRLRQEGIDARVVTAPEVFGQLTKDAILGNAEKLLHSIQVVIGTKEETFQEAVERESPRVLFVCGETFVRSLSVLSHLSPKGVALVPVLERFEASSGVVWKGGIAGGVQGWIVPAEETKGQLERLGAGAGRVLLGGLPVSGIGVTEEEREGLRARFGFQGAEVAIVRATMFTGRELERLMFQLSLLPGGQRLIFHHDSNQRVADQVRKLAEEKGVAAQMFGHVEDLYRYVAAADVIVTKVGDRVALEAVASRVPLLLMEGEDSVLVRRGAGWWVGNGGQIVNAMSDILLPRFAPELKQAQQGLIPEDTRERLYEAIRKAIELAPHWLEVDAQVVPRPTVEPEVGGGSGATGLAPYGESGGVFQEIGKRSERGLDAGDPLAQMRRRFEGGEPVEGRRPLYGAEEGGEQGQGEATPNRRREVVMIDERQAKAMMTELILEQKGKERELEEALEGESVWYRRLNLVRTTGGGEDLEKTAMESLKVAKRRSEELKRELDGIERRKRTVKEALMRGRGDQPVGFDRYEVDREGVERLNMEERFRKLEDDARLDDFKRRFDEN